MMVKQLETQRDGRGAAPLLVLRSEIKLTYAENARPL